ncbi:type IX secretion system sortase PorU [Marinilongibacter aquaticus]|uniref:type IX secretion system sortase PorU n=1 Tax=Marinilongibacter aquaticus TaxID=2975157 RepID=UPI0021BD6EFF|nr:type IX secretion system sortase PorU [Marinilongibacter aquaticus]UBM57920.1 type IX secretion system sortase PorU [Marinilongibacter aquaticus]
MKKALLTYFFLFQSVFSFSQTQTGLWFKLSIPETGVYKIEQSTLKKWGIDPTQNPPSQIRFFVSPLKVLPQKNSETPENSLVEIPIRINDQNQKWDAEDYILFYAEDAHSISYESGHFHFTPNPYANTNYVFMQLGGGPSKQLVTNKSETLSSEKIESLASFNTYAPEINNVLNSGREWFGDYFFSEYFYNIETPGRLTDQNINVYSRLIGQTYEDTDLDVLADGEPIYQQPLYKIDYKWNDAYKRYNRAGEISETNRDFKNANEKIKILFRLPSDIDISSGAYIDQIEWTYPRKIEAFAQQYRAYHLGKQPTSFTLQGATENDFVWQINNPFTYTQLAPDSQGGYQIQADSSIQNLAFFSIKNTLSVTEIQTINGIDFDQMPSPDLLIVYPAYFKEEVETLADFRRTHDGLDVQTVDIQTVYNSFSGGKQDLTAIRNLCRKLWLKDQKLKYLLLFGDADFDFRNIHAFDYVKPERLIPTYESRESLEPIYSYSSDDYFGFLEDFEGEWPEGVSIAGSWQSTQSEDHTLDIAVGRLPVKDKLEAQQLVAKLIHYSSNPSAFDEWKRRATFIADDGDYNTHVKDAEAFSKLLTEENESMQMQKVYVDAFTQTQTELGERVPQANQAFEKAIREGTFLVNYNGHGAENGWTDEKLLTITQIVNWRNYDKLPIFFTATCQFGRYDNPSLVSGAELALLNPDGGAIALLTTTRPVFSSTNYRINQAFYKHLFVQDAEPRRIGDVFRETKNASIQGELNRNFTLLGDPSMAIAYPQNKVKLKTINNEKPEGQLLKGLAEVTLSGEIENQSNFNGTIRISLYDKEDTLSTLGQNENSKAEYGLRRNKLFEGQAEVKNGTFSTRFQMPQHINPALGPGQLYFYALSTDSTQEAIGGNRSFLIGQMADSDFTDKTPPKISLQVDQQKKELLFSIEDDSGINISATDPEHEIILILDDTLSLVANDYFRSNISGNGGLLSFQLTDNLTNIPRKAELKVSDLYNNRSMQSFSFTIESKPFQLTAMNVFPNPVKDILNISFEHNRAGQNLHFELYYFNELGQKVATETKDCYACPTHVSFGTNLGEILTVNGKYYYRLVGNNLDSEEKTVHSDRLFFWK